VQPILAVIVAAPLAQPEPVQPAKVEPVAGVAVKVTRVPLLYNAEHVLPQLMPEGALVTVPMPVPAFEMERLKLWGAWGLNVAVQV
jgi:hypothetical protein